MTNETTPTTSYHGVVHCSEEDGKKTFQWVWTPTPADGEHCQLDFGARLEAKLGDGWPDGSHFYYMTIVAGKKDGEKGWDKANPRSIWDFKDGAWKRNDSSPDGPADLDLVPELSDTETLVLENHDLNKDLEGVLFEPLVLDANGERLNPDPEVILKKKPTGNG